MYSSSIYSSPMDPPKWTDSFTRPYDEGGILEKYRGEKILALPFDLIYGHFFFRPIAALAQIPSLLPIKSWKTSISQAVAPGLKPENQLASCLVVSVAGMAYSSAVNTPIGTYIHVVLSVIHVLNLANAKNAKAVISGLQATISNLRENSNILKAALADRKELNRNLEEAKKQNKELLKSMDDLSASSLADRQKLSESLEETKKQNKELLQKIDGLPVFIAAFQEIQATIEQAGTQGKDLGETLTTISSQVSEMKKVHDVVAGYFNPSDEGAPSQMQELIELLRGLKKQDVAQLSFLSMMHEQMKAIQNDVNAIKTHTGTPPRSGKPLQANEEEG